LTEAELAKKLELMQQHFALQHNAEL